MFDSQTSNASRPNGYALFPTMNGFSGSGNTSALYTSVNGVSGGIDVATNHSAELGTGVQYTGALEAPVRKIHTIRWKNKRLSLAVTPQSLALPLSKRGSYFPLSVNTLVAAHEIVKLTLAYGPHSLASRTQPN